VSGQFRSVHPVAFCFFFLLRFVRRIHPARCLGLRTPFRRTHACRVCSRGLYACFATALCAHYHLPGFARCGNDILLPLCCRAVARTTRGWTRARLLYLLPAPAGAPRGGFINSIIRTMSRFGCRSTPRAPHAGAYGLWLHTRRTTRTRRWPYHVLTITTPIFWLRRTRRARAPSGYGVMDVIGRL